MKIVRCTTAFIDREQEQEFVWVNTAHIRSMRIVKTVAVEDRPNRIPNVVYTKINMINGQVIDVAESPDEIVVKAL